MFSPPHPAPRCGHTGYQHPKCYARADGDCSTKISKEHFISRALLQRIAIDATAKIAGLAWQRPQTFNRIPVDGLASNILCDRHNSILSSLDQTMTRFVRAIHHFDRSSVKGFSSRTFDGTHIERWMLKCIIGLVASKNLRSTIKFECVDVLFERISWPEGWGVYFNLANGPVYHTDSILIETLVGPSQLILAVKFFLQGLPFVLCLGKPDNPRAFGTWRPTEIKLRCEAAERSLKFQWEKLPHGDSITLTRTGSYDGHPPDWKEWERIA